MKVKGFAVFCSLLFLIGAGVFSPSSGRAAQNSGGCESCHPQISKVLPQGHPQVPSGNGQNCQTCHSRQGGASPFAWSVHYLHFSREKFTGACGSCHPVGPDGNLRLPGEDQGGKAGKEAADKAAPYFQSWGRSNFLDHDHAAKKISCADCHATFFPEGRAPQDRCLGCHKSYESVAELTKDRKPNPHASHLGDIRCTICHKAHEKPALYCDQCHQFDFTSSKQRK
jgi:hypothetical protein